MLREQVRALSLSLSHNTNASLRERGVIRDGRRGWQNLVKVSPWKAPTKRGDPRTRAKTGASREEDLLLRPLREEDGIWSNQCGRMSARPSRLPRRAFIF